MTRTNTRTTGLAKYEAQERLRAEIKILEKTVASTHLQNSHEQAEAWEQLAYKWSQLQPKAKISGKRDSNRISREDATVRASWSNPSSFDVNTSEGWTDSGPNTDEADAMDARRGGGCTGGLGEAPEDQGPRFNTPRFVLDHGSFSRYCERLFTKRKKEHPTLVEFERSKSAVDTQILWTYFMDRASYEEIFDEFGRVAENDAYGVYDISTKDANPVAEAIEVAAKRSGTFSCFDEDDNCYTFCDQVNGRFRKVTGRKVNAEIFRVDFRVLNEDDKYYLPAKLDPSKKESIRPLQRYIDDLVQEGRALMNLAKPTKAERKAESLRREAEKEAVYARNQIGGGQDPKLWENGSARYASRAHPRNTIADRERSRQGFGEQVKSRRRDQSDERTGPVPALAARTRTRREGLRAFNDTDQGWWQAKPGEPTGHATPGPAIG